MLITCVSAGPDGTSTAALALALASPRPTLLVEADLSAHSGVRYGYLYDSPGTPLDAGVGLHRLAQADWARASAEETLVPAFEDQLRRLDAGDRRYVLPGLTDPRQAGALASTWPTLAELLQITSQQAGYDVIVDAGRVTVDRGRVHPVLTPVALLHQADLVLLVMRARRTSVAPAPPVLDILRGELAAAGARPDALGLLVIEQGGYSVGEVSRALGVPVLGRLAWDERTAGYLAGEEPRPRRLERSALMRDARSAASHLSAVASKRRLDLQLAAAQARHPAVASVVHRLAQGEAVIGRG